MSSVTPGSGDVRSRLRLALRAAMKDRDTIAVSALRSTLAAIANAEAIPAATAAATAPATGGHQYVAGGTEGLAATEASRRDVSEEEASEIMRAEAAERRAAARQYQAAGHTDRAERLLREAEVIERVL